MSIKPPRLHSFVDGHPVERARMAPRLRGDDVIAEVTSLCGDDAEPRQIYRNA